MVRQIELCLASILALLLRGMNRLNRTKIHAPAKAATNRTMTCTFVQGIYVAPDALIKWTCFSNVALSAHMDKRFIRRLFTTDASNAKNSTRC